MKNLLIIINLLSILSANSFSQTATFDLKKGILTLPTIAVTPDVGTFAATLQRTNTETFVFKMKTLEKIEPTENPSSYYDIPNGRLVIPLVVVGADSYHAELQLTTPPLVPLHYTLTSARDLGLKQVSAVVETEPVPVRGDAADDPAIWVHPTDPSQSVLITTQKQGALIVYDLAGREIQYLTDGNMNNVDLRDGFKLGQNAITLVTASNRSTNSLALYQFNPNSRQLETVAARTITSNLSEVYGLCMYYRVKTGNYYAFVNDKTGAVEQWELFAVNGKVDAKLVRILKVNSQVEGCVADDKLGYFYIAEERVGIWRFVADPEGGQEGVLIDTVDTAHLVPEIEGLTIYYAGETEGYIIASNQGERSFAVYERGGQNAFIGKFQIMENETKGIDAVHDTDGIDVTPVALGKTFPFGLFVAQDGINFDFAQNQNFKLVPWERIANALNLIVYTDNDSP